MPLLNECFQRKIGSTFTSCGFENHLLHTTRFYLRITQSHLKRHALVFGIGLVFVNFQLFSFLQYLIP